MRTKKTTLHVFDPATFDEELFRLNVLSEEGWQLTEYHSLYQKFRRDDSVVYRYALDCQGSLSVHDFRRYREEYAAQGWEFVSQFRECWYVFRKPLDLSLPEEEYLIYTDEPSFQAMKRTVPLSLSTAFLFSFVNFLLTPELGWLIYGVTAIVMLAFDLMRRRRLKRSRPVPTPRRWHIWQLAFPLAVLAIALSILVFHVRADYTLDLRGLQAGVQSAEFTVKLPDFYGLEFYPYPGDAPRPQISPVQAITWSKWPCVRKIYFTFR